jgi:hypothetical protein
VWGAWAALLLGQADPQALHCGGYLIERERAEVVVRFSDGAQMNRYVVPAAAPIGCGLPGQLLVAGSHLEAIELDSERRFRGGRLRAPRPRALSLNGGRVTLVAPDGTETVVPHPLLTPSGQPGDGGGLVALSDERFALWREAGALQVGGRGGWADAVPLPFPTGAPVPAGEDIVVAGCQTGSAVVTRLDGGGQTRATWTWNEGCLGAVADVAGRLLTTSEDTLLEVVPGGRFEALGKIEPGATLVPGLDEAVLCVGKVIRKQSPEPTRCSARDGSWHSSGTWERLPLGCGHFLVEVAFGDRAITVRDARSGAEVRRRRLRGERLLGCSGHELFLERDGLVTLRLPELSPAWRSGAAQPRVVAVARSGKSVAVVRQGGAITFLDRP